MKLLLSLALAVLLSACGGGDGVFTDAEIQAIEARDTQPQVKAVIKGVVPAASMPPAQWVRHDIGDPYEPVMLHCSAGADKLIVYLHSWNATGYEGPDIYPSGIAGACVLSPNFGGRNDDVDAFASESSMERIDRAIEYARPLTGLTGPVDIIAFSHGTNVAMGYMGEFPAKVRRASLWSVFYDLELFRNTTVLVGHIETMDTVLGAPTVNDPEYLARSARNRLEGISAAVKHVHLNVGTMDRTTIAQHGELARQHLADKKIPVALSYWPIDHQFAAAQRAEAVRQLAATLP